MLRRGKIPAIALTGIGLLAACSRTALTVEAGSAASSSGSGGTGGGVVNVEPAWERTNEHFLMTVPYLVYYAMTPYPQQLYTENDTPAGTSFTWTSSAWDGEGIGVGNMSIPGYVTGDYWFKTYDRVNDGVIATYYWFRTTVDVGTLAGMLEIVMFDKYHPGRVTLNEGFSVFVNGVPQPEMPNVTEWSNSNGDPMYGKGCKLDISLATEWSCDAVSIPLESFHDGANEIAVLFDERYWLGGLGHLVFSLRRAAP